MFGDCRGASAQACDYKRKGLQVRFPSEINRNSTVLEFGESGERRVLTLGFVCLSRYTRDIQREADSPYIQESCRHYHVNSFDVTLCNCGQSHLGHSECVSELCVSYFEFDRAGEAASKRQFLDKQISIYNS